MACAAITDEERDITCSICLDIYNKPVYLQCGHSYCCPCIERHWAVQSGPQGGYTCPQCRDSMPDKPSPSKNVVLATLVDEYWKRVKLQAVGGQRSLLNGGGGDGKEGEWKACGDGSTDRDSREAPPEEYECARSRLQAIYPKWTEKREATIASLQSMVELMRERQKNVNIAKVTGSAAGIVGGVMSIVGLALIPVTFGASLGLIIAGAAAGVAGGITGAGASIALAVLNKMNSGEAQELLEQDTRLSVEFHAAVLRLNRAAGGGGGVGHDSLNLPQVAKNVTQIGIAALTVAEDVAAGALRGTAGAALRVTGFVLSSVFLVVDVASVVRSSLDLSQGSPSVIADRMQEIVNSLRAQMEHMDKLYYRL